MEKFLSSLWLGWGLQLLRGLVVTIEISVGGYIAGLLIGGLVAAVKLGGPKWAVKIANGYSTICRAVPEILLILIIFYAGQSGLNALLDLIGVGTVGISGFFAAIAVLGIVQGAYASEILRGAVLAIPRGQIEAAKAFGMHGIVLFGRTILPLMVPYAFAGLSNLWMAIIKDSVLVSVVGYNELTFTGSQAAGATKFYVQYYLLLGVIYYVITQFSNVFINKFEAGFLRWTPRSE